MNTSGRVHPLVRVPPPLFFVMTFLAGVGIYHIVPLGVHSLGLMQAGRIIGMALLAGGLLLALSCLAIFFWARTTAISHRTASKLVTWGPYRLTRNPMYVSLVLAYLGVALLLTEIWPLFLLPLPVSIIHRLVIPYEETRLREAFGSACEQ